MSDTDKLINELKHENALFLEKPSNDCWCPRCGEELLNSDPILNSNSRQVDGVLICDPCGIEEGELFVIGSPLKLVDWAYFK